MVIQKSQYILETEVSLHLCPAIIARSPPLFTASFSGDSVGDLDFSHPLAVTRHALSWKNSVRKGQIK